MLWWIAAPDAISAHDVFSKDLTSISRRAQLPAPQYFKKSVLCAVLLLGSLAHLVFWVTRVMQPEPLRSNVSIAGCSDSSPRTSCLLKEAKMHSRIPWGSLTRCRDVRWLYGASYLKHLKTGFHTWVSDNLLTPSLAGNDQFLSQSRSTEKLQCWNWLWEGLSFSSASPLVRCLRTSWNRHDQHIALRVPSQLNLGHDRAIKPFGWRHRWLLQQQCGLHPRDCAIFFQQTESGILWLLIYRVLKKGLISGEDTRKVQCVCFQENLQETTYVFPCFFP